MKTLTQNPHNKTQFIEKGDNKFTYKSSLPYLQISVNNISIVHMLKSEYDLWSIEANLALVEHAVLR